MVENNGKIWRKAKLRKGSDWNEFKNCNFGRESLQSQQIGLPINLHITFPFGLGGSSLFLENKQSRELIRILPGGGRLYNHTKESGERVHRRGDWEKAHEARRLNHHKHNNETTSSKIINTSLFSKYYFQIYLIG